MSFTVPPAPLASIHRLDDYRTELLQEPDVDAGQVWGEVMAAAQLFGALRDAGMSIRFDVEDPTRAPRVRITDLQGRTLREIAPEVACDPGALEADVLGPAA